MTRCHARSMILNMSATLMHSHIKKTLNTLTVLRCYTLAMS